MLKFLKQRAHKLKAIFRTWFESFLAFEIGFRLKDFVSKDVFIPAVAAAILPVILRWLNPKDSFPGE
jgi:predicted membrane protein